MYHTNRDRGMYLASTTVLVVLLCLVGMCATQNRVEVERFDSNPLVNETNMAPQCNGAYDVNFPSIVKAPLWLKERLQPHIGYQPKYLMYYSDHHGQQIYLSCSNHVDGPWVSYAPGTTLTLAAVLAAFNTTTNSTSAEVASADVYIDNDAQVVRMYFHRRVPNDNFAIVTSVAFALDGINFDVIWTADLLTAYARHFIWNGQFYFTDRQGYLWSSHDGLTNFTAGPTIIATAFTEPSIVIPNNTYNGYLRHLGLYLNADVLYVYGSRVGDAPERILYTTIPLNDNWDTWNVSMPVTELIRPTTVYEGADLPNVPSAKGDAVGPVNQLRDPYPFSTEDGCYLYYTVAGEQGIAGIQLPDSFCFLTTTTTVVVTTVTTTTTTVTNKG
jgi:hypothetical protein